MSSYYEHNGIEAWEIIDIVMLYYEGQLTGSEAFYLGSVLKYLLRYKFKGQSESDLEKAKDYIDRLMEEI